ncbi:HCL067Cp [Eremothecium sinecaudum]|uniref:RING-type E3 ubiquitin transferase n=1 Tax=Eremothecium sinecaudum TaxID=45286 RepID=A0A0X8HRG0_9SACH|nr:HCL067Cp [Eremothecium sinecaudum]AMD20084.1 HCL067Cp [Eremothecium sinecaudum]
MSSSVQSVIKDILCITNDPSDLSSATRKYTLIHEDDNEGVLDFTLESLDSLLVSQLTENGRLQQQPLGYLHDSFQRCQQLKRLNKSNTDQDVQNTLVEIERLLVGYAVVCFQIEEFAIGGSFLTYVRDIVQHTDQYTDLLSAMIQRAIRDETVFEVTNNFFSALIELIKEMNDSRANKFDLNDLTYNRVLTLFELFVSFKPVAAIFSQLDGFFFPYDAKPNSIEKITLLGPILTLSPMNLNVAARNYGENLERTQQQTNIIHESLQTEHKVILNRLFYIVDKIIRGSSESRNGVLSYFAQIVNKNHLRRGDHAQHNKLSSNAFMTNITLILVRFSQPFLDSTYKKIDKIDVNYFNNLNLYIDLSQETRMNSDFKEADEFHDKNRKSDDNKPNFISDCFFLTLTYLHYGLGGTLLYDEKVTPQLKRMKQELKQIKDAANNSSNTDIFARFAAMQLPSLEKTCTTLQSILDSIQGVFSNKEIQMEVFEFICGVSTFLVRVVDPSHEFPFKNLELPLIPDQVGVENVDNAEFLRAHAQVPFKYYPEFVVEGPINYCLYISKYINNPIFRHPRLHSFVELATVILRCPELVSNPHLKGKLVQVLSIGATALGDNSPGFMMEIFENCELVRKNIFYALLDFYVIVEKTGSSSQFYDKFNARYSISIVLEELYKISAYRNELFLQSQKNPDFFIRFIARMLNDLTFLLDEGLTNLTEVHNISKELELRARNLPPTREEDNEELQAKLTAAERQARSSCSLADKSMILFNVFTRDIPKAFVSPELVDRLAGMLNYNLVSLVGPKCRELKVKDPSKFQFNPKSLLKSLSEIYINLSEQDEFISAVARDGRSFNKDLFDRLVHILGHKTGLASPEQCEKLTNFANKTYQRKLDAEEEDMDMGDVPDEFLDPLMYTIMKDPVILPTSKVTIDRSTIKAHLLSDSTDPFNRTPLKLEDVIPNESLKNKIEEFRMTKQRNK